MPNPVQDVNRVVRTVIEAADPALRPVVRLRRFVVKRVELISGETAEESGRSSTARAGRTGQKRTTAAKRPK